MSQKTMVSLESLILHPAQPPARTQNTVALQSSIMAEGQQVPVLLASDGRTVLSGARRITALRSIGKKEVWIVISEHKPDSDAALRVLLASNEQSEMSRLEKLHVLRYAQTSRKISLRQAVKLVGISPTEGSFLCKLAKAAEGVVEAVDKFDRTNGRQGLSWSAFKEMANMSQEEQLEILGSGRTKAKQVRKQRKEKAKAKQTKRMIESGDNFEAAYSTAQEMVACLYPIHIFVTTTTNGALAEMRDVLTPDVLAIMGEIVEALA